MSALGIIGSVVAGGVSGAGAGMAQAAKMDYDSQLQRQRDELLQKGAERHLALQQQFLSAEGEKNRDTTRTEHALDRGQQVEIADKAAALHYSQLAASKEQHSGVLAEQSRHNKAIEGLAATDAKKLQIGEDGVLNSITPDGKGGFLAKQVLDEEGEPLVVGKNLNQADAKKIEVIQKQVTNAETMLTKLSNPATAMFEGIAKDTNDVAALRRRYQSIIDSGYGELNDILGTSLGPKPANGAGGAKPWERKWSGK